MVSRSAALSARAPANVSAPCAGSQGGISRRSTTRATVSMREETSSNEVSANGAAPPSRWHEALRAVMIGAMSRVNVGLAAAAVCCACGAPAVGHTVAAATVAQRTTRIAAVLDIFYG